MIIDCEYCNGTGRMIDRHTLYKSDETGIEIKSDPFETECIACDGSGKADVPDDYRDESTATALNPNPQKTEIEILRVTPLEVGWTYQSVLQQPNYITNKHQTSGYLHYGVIGTELYLYWSVEQNATVEDVQRYIRDLLSQYGR